MCGPRWEPAPAHVCTKLRRLSIASFQVHTTLGAGEVQLFDTYKRGVECSRGHHYQIPTSSLFEEITPAKNHLSQLRNQRNLRNNEKQRLVVF